MAADDIAYMKMAIEEAAKSRSENERVHPRVGVVIVKEGEVLARAHRGELNLGEHAEFTVLEKKLSTDSLAGATVYTTLEPCTTRNHPKVLCAYRLVECRIRRVVIGMLDPNENICGRGLWYLRESNIETDLFPHELMSRTDETAKSELEQATSQPEVGEFAAGLLAEIASDVGNMDEAVHVCQKTAETADDPDTKARLMLKAATVLDEANQHEAAAATLRSVLGLSLTLQTHSHMLTALADLSRGAHAPLIKAALLTRAASLEPTARTMFAAAYALSEAGLHGLSALQYSFLLRFEHTDVTGRNNLAVALQSLGLTGMAVSHFKNAANGGSTLAMANLAQSYIDAGFFDEAEEVIAKARTTESPHQNVGSAMVALAQQQERESERWTDPIEWTKAV